MRRTYRYLGKPVRDFDASYIDIETTSASQGKKKEKKNLDRFYWYLPRYLVSEGKLSLAVSSREPHIHVRETLQGFRYKCNYEVRTLNKFK